MIYKYQRLKDLPRELVDRCRLLATPEMRDSFNLGYVYDILGQTNPNVGIGMRLAAYSGVDKKLLGWALLTLNDGHLPHKLQVYVRKSHRRGGIGTELVNSFQNDIQYGDKIEVPGEDVTACLFWNSIEYPYLVITPNACVSMSG